MIAIEASASRVRRATRRDEAELLELCRRQHAEHVGRGAFSADKVRNLMRQAFDRGFNAPAVIGVAGQSCIEGSICIVVDTPWYGDAPFLRGVWNYVLPEWRRTTTPRDLLAFATQLTEPGPVGFGLELRMDIPVNQRTEGQVRLYKRQLGEPASYEWVCGSDNFNLRAG